MVGAEHVESQRSSESVPSGVGKLSFHASLPCNDGGVRGRGKATGPFEVYWGREEVLREVDYKGNSFNPNSFTCFREKQCEFHPGALPGPVLSSASFCCTLHPSEFVSFLFPSL